MNQKIMPYYISFNQYFRSLIITIEPISYIVPSSLCGLCWQSEDSGWLWQYLWLLMLPLQNRSTGLNQDSTAWCYQYSLTTYFCGIFILSWSINMIKLKRNLTKLFLNSQWLLVHICNYNTVGFFLVQCSKWLYMVHPIAITRWKPSTFMRIKATKIRKYKLWHMSVLLCMLKVLPAY